MYFLPIINGFNFSVQSVLTTSRTVSLILLFFFLPKHFRLYNTAFCRILSHTTIPFHLRWNVGWWIPFNDAEKILFPIVYYIFIYIRLFPHTLFWTMSNLFFKTVDTTVGCRKVFHITLFGKLTSFFFFQRSTNGYFLSTSDTEPFN